MADTNKLKTYKPRNYPQQSDGQPKFLNEEFGRLSDSLKSLHEHADDSDGEINSLTDRMTTAESNITALDTREAADKSELQTNIDNEVTARTAADSALDGRLDTIEATLPNKANNGANTDITSLDMDVQDSWSITIPYPENGRKYPIQPVAKHGGTVQSIERVTQAGTATLDVEHNGTSFGGADSLSATTTYTGMTPSSGQAFSSGDTFYVTPSSADTAEFLTVVIYFKRKLPA